MERHPASDALADGQAKLIVVLVGVLADLTAPGDGHHLVVAYPVDANVVVIDQLAQLGRDGLADLGHRRESGESGAQLLDGLKLRGPGRHLLVVARVANGGTGLCAERLQQLKVVGVPIVALVVVQGEGAQDFAVGKERGDGHRLEALRQDVLAHGHATLIGGIVGGRLCAPRLDGMLIDGASVRVPHGGREAIRQPPGEAGL